MPATSRLSSPRPGLKTERATRNMANWPARVTLYEREYFSGRALTITGDMPDLGDFDNSVSSAIVHEGDWALYSEIKYSGKRMILNEGESYSSLPVLSNTASSISRI
ncbi:gamma-crystallin N-like [Haliotis asinina]|uniref:gamma-crystallin N-like n=1 Tax=Haliotis asinina TaxID=109174 RepID=UPI003531F766